jgi:hypothetical protein
LTAESTASDTSADEGVRRAIIVLGVLGLLAGVAGTVIALRAGLSLAETSGARVGFFHHTNPLGGLVSVALASIALLGGLRQLRALVLLAGAGFTAAALSVVVGGAVRELNVLGGTGSSLSVYLGLGVGLLVCGAVLRPARQADGGG